MSQLWYISYSGKGGEIQPEHKKQLDEVIRSLPSFVEHDDKYDYYVMDKGRWNTIAFRNEGVQLELANLDAAFLSDLKRLVDFARSMGMNMFGDEVTPEDEFTEEDLEEFFRPPTSP